MNNRDLRDGALYHFVLMFLRQADKVLLALKPEGDKIGAGCWNGVGGGYEKATDFALEHTVCREADEECGIHIKLAHTTKVAVIDFHTITADKGIAICRVHTYLVWKWDGIPQHAQWFSLKDACTLRDLMPADRIWWPKILLKNEKIRGYVSLSQNQQAVCSIPLFEKVESFETDLDP